MLALVAEFERDRIKERSAEGRMAKRRDGGHIGGSAPFGFRKIGAGRAARLEPDPTEQAALADMRTLAADGLASRAIAAAVRERHGIAVSHVTVRAVLARNAGAPAPPQSRHAAILAELDARNAPDIAYREAFSTGAKPALKRGETWRGRLEAWVRAAPARA